jgi:hypothetical protein
MTSTAACSAPAAAGPARVRGARPGRAAAADTGRCVRLRRRRGRQAADRRRKDAPPEETAAWERQRHQQSSQRICVEHSIAEPKQWRSLQRYLGRREYFQETALAIAGLASDRAAAR